MVIGPSTLDLNFSESPHAGTHHPLCGTDWQVHTVDYMTAAGKLLFRRNTRRLKCRKTQAKERFKPESDSQC